MANLENKTQIIKYFTQNGYFVWNVLNKCPVAGVGDKGWSKILYEDIKGYWDLSSTSWGIRTGRQPNGDYIIGLDFDTWFKSGNTYVACNNTIKLLDEFTILLGDRKDGFYISGTERNRGCLVNISKCHDIHRLLEEIGKGRFQANNYHLEILNGHNLVIPPTATHCKISGVLRERHFMNDKYIHDLKHGDAVYNFIFDYICKCRPKHDVPKSLIKTKKEKQVLGQAVENMLSNGQLVRGFNENLLDFLNCLNPERGATYDNWYKIGIACKKNCVNEADKLHAYNIFKLWSSKLDGYNPSEFDKHWNSWDNYLDNYNGLNFNYIMSCARNDNPSKWMMCWLKYEANLEKQETQSKIELFEKEVRCILEPRCWLTRKISPTGINRWIMTTNYEDIEHKYHMKFDLEFIKGYKTTNKKQLYYDTYEFLPTFKPVEKNDIKIYQSFRGWDILNKKITVQPENTTQVLVNHSEHTYQIEHYGASRIIIEHIQKIINEPKTSWLLLQWIANLIIEPDERALCVPLIKGREGCGKTTIFEIITRIIDGGNYSGGSEYCCMIDDPKDILDRFNKILWEKILINLNEPSIGSLTTFADKNKRLITDSTINIEGKGENAFPTKNTLWQIITTNNDNIISLSATERRYFLIQCKDVFIGNSEHFINLRKAINSDEALMDFYQFLKQIRNPNFKYIDYTTYINDNKTFYHKQMVQTSISPIWGLITDYLYELDFQDKATLMKKPTELHKDLNAYCRQRGLNNPEDANSIKTKLLDIDSKCFKRTRVPTLDGKEKREEQYVLEIAKIREYMKAKNLEDTTVDE
jgi:hypothetical protein